MSWTSLIIAYAAFVLGRNGVPLLPAGLALVVLLVLLLSIVGVNA